MSLIVIATNGCENGPCPTFYLTFDGSDVIVRGYKTTAPEHIPDDLPDHEGVLRIPIKDWQRLLSELPPELHDERLSDLPR
ncbi:MAG: hypothetical protein ACRDTA_11905 [Pseudonocardiaceae bacterium]